MSPLQLPPQITPAEFEQAQLAHDRVILAHLGLDAMVKRATRDNVGEFPSQWAADFLAITSALKSVSSAFAVALEKWQPHE